MLYNLADDISETTDQAAEEPAKASELRNLLIEWESNMVKAKPRGGLNQQEQEWFKERLE